MALSGASGVHFLILDGPREHHGVSAKHLPRYAREWNYRFNRRRRIGDLADFVLQRAMAQPTITYRQRSMVCKRRARYLSLAG